MAGHEALPKDLEKQLKEVFKRLSYTVSIYLFTDRRQPREIAEAARNLVKIFQGLSEKIAFEEHDLNDDLAKEWHVYRAPRRPSPSSRIFRDPTGRRKRKRNTWSEAAGAVCGQAAPARDDRVWAAGCQGEEVSLFFVVSVPPFRAGFFDGALQFGVDLVLEAPGQRRPFLHDPFRFVAPVGLLQFIGQVDQSAQRFPHRHFTPACGHGNARAHVFPGQPAGFGIPSPS